MQRLSLGDGLQGCVLEVRDEELDPQGAERNTVHQRASELKKNRHVFCHVISLAQGRIKLKPPTTMGLDEPLGCTLT